MINLQQRYILNNPFISGGSAMAFYLDTFCIAADDDTGIILLKMDLKEQGRYFKVFPMELPEEEKARKKIKPDIESMVVIDNKILLIPSGSKPNRHVGALFSMRELRSEIVNFKNCYAFLESQLTDLNIEGAVVIQDHILLFQRGNSKLHHNGIIQLSLNSFLQDEVRDYHFTPVNLGTIEGTHFTFTDATLMNQKILFLAAAEKTESTYDDGDFAGAIIGMMDLKGNIQKTLPLNIASKPEGLCIAGEEFFLVTDDDNRKTPSILYSGSLSSLLID